MLISCPRFSHITTYVRYKLHVELKLTGKALLGLALVAMCVPTSLPWQHSRVLGIIVPLHQSIKASRAFVEGSSSARRLHWTMDSLSRIIAEAPSLLTFRSYLERHLID